MAGVDDVYTLSGKYYQKLGEVWDHETKDFKVMYKPLYACGNKEGSFEAHHLAVSTFERWERKFTKVQDSETLSKIIQNQQPFLVSAQSVCDISAGNPTLPLVTVPLPTAVSKSSAAIAVSVSDVILPAPASAPASAAPPATAATAVATISEDVVPTGVSGNNSYYCRTQSGYGTRSLSPYYTLDFDPCWQRMIVSGQKCASTRVLNASINGSEPHLQDLVDAVLSLSSSSSSPSSSYSNADSSGGVDTYAVSGDTAFARLKITSVATSLTFGSLTQEIAEIEQFETVQAFQECLLQYYPTIQRDDAVHVFYFSVVM